jgi:alkylhydroperoxidase family enzyme
MEKSDIAELKVDGFTEKDILDINQITCYFAYVNRLADDLGVPLVSYWNKETADSVAVSLFYKFIITFL